MQCDLSKTALVTLDCQYGIMDLVSGSEAIVNPASKVVSVVREHKLPIIHVGLGFSEGYPEVSPRNPVFSTLKEKKLFIKGSESSKFHEDLVKHDDIIVYKQRYSGFSENTLNMILRSNNIEHIILFGISTSGIVLSTLRQAFDLDYQCTVIKDACFDRDEEVHRVLTEKIFKMQANVISSTEFNLD